MKRCLLPIPTLLYKEQNYYSESSPSITTRTSDNVEALTLKLNSPLVKKHTPFPRITGLKAERDLKILYIYLNQASDNRQHYRIKEQSSFTL